MADVDFHIKRGSVAFTWWWRAVPVMAVTIIRVRHALTWTRGWRGAGEAKWSDFTFLLREIIGLADGLDRGSVTKRRQG